MEIAIERLEDEAPKRSKSYHEDFTVVINDKRLLSVYSQTYGPNSVTDKWLTELQKACRNKKYPIVVGVSVDNENLGESPCDTLTICIGSNCLTFELPDAEWKDDGYVGSDQASRAMKDFLADPKLLFVGMDMGEVSKTLEKFQTLKIARSGDVRALAVKLLKEEIGHVSEKRRKSLTLDDVAKQLLDKRMDVDRPRSIERNDPYYWYYYRFAPNRKDGRKRYQINEEFVKFQTLDAFWCHEIGMKYLEEFKKLASSSSY